MICTLYSHSVGFENVLEILKINYTNGVFSVGNQDGLKIIDIKLKGGFFSSGSKLKISYRERKEPSYQLSANTDCPLNENLKGLYGFVSSLPTKNEKVKSLFLQKIQTMNCEFSFIQVEGKTKNLKQVIQNLSNELDAVLFVQPETVISKSNGQHFLDNNLNLIIDKNGNCEIDHLEVTINSETFDGDQIEIKEDQKKRKEKSHNIIKEHNIKLNVNLPFIESEEETHIRTPKEIAERVVILAFTNMVAFNNMSGDQAIEIIKKYGLWELVTPKEKAFLENPTDESKNQETWKCECIWILLWALKIVDDIGFPNVLADLNKVPVEQYPIREGKDPNDFISSHQEVRSKSEILDANDLYYRMDWACVDARINGRQMTEIHGGVVYERHYALNWLITYMDSDWDDVTCDT